MCRCVHVSDSLILGGEAVGGGGGRPSSAGGGGEIRAKIPGFIQILRKISGGKTKFRGARPLSPPLVAPYKLKGGPLIFPDLANFRKISG